MDALIQDIRYAVRTLARAPGFTAAALLTLALGIGANSTLFSVLNGVLLKPLPYEAPEALMSLRVQSQSRPQPGPVAHTDYQRWRDDSRVLESIAAYRSAEWNLTGSGEPVRVSGLSATPELFAVLGERPVLGRVFTAEEDRARAPVVLLRHAFWRDRFGGDSAIVGKSIMLDGRATQVIGVMPESFAFPRSADMWAPASLPVDASSGITMFVSVLGRLADGARPEAALAELTAIHARYESQRPDYMRGATINAMSLHERMFGPTRPIIMLLFGAVGLVLLIACANVASLLLARASARSREWAIRASLGAGRARLMRQMLVESLLLAALGGAAGLLIPVWATGPLLRAEPFASVRHLGIGVDGAVLGFTLLLTLLTGLLFGLAPALAAARTDLVEGLKQAGRSVRSARLRQALVISELATAVVLLIGAGLLLRSLLNFVAIDPGFRPERVMSMTIFLPYERYAETPARDAFYGELLRRAAGIRGVESAALADALPLHGFRMSRPVGVDGRPSTEQGTSHANLNAVTADYFRTVGISLIAGRGLGDGDREGSAPVAVVNAAFARQFFGTAGAIGKRIDLSGGTPDHATVVGVIADVRQLGQDVMAQPEMFLAAAQMGYLPANLVMRLDGEQPGLAANLRRIVAGLDPLQPMPQLLSLEGELAESLAGRRFQATMVGLFAIVALMLASGGLFGVMAYVVSMRTREIGVRMALGAPRRDVVRMVLGQGTRMAAAGIAIGLALALVLTRLISAMLFQVSATDSLTFFTVPLVLLVVALAACWLPARRATRVDPMTALRND